MSSANGSGRHLGILAHSTGGAALCFLTYCQEGFQRTGRHVRAARDGHTRVGVLGTW